MKLSEQTQLLEPARPVTTSPVRVPPRRRAIEQTALLALRAAETVFLVAGVLAFAGAILPLVGTGGMVGELAAGQVAEESGIVQPVFRLLYLGTACILLVRARGALSGVLRHPWSWALLAITAASAAWSVAPDVSVQQAVRILAASLFGLVLVAGRDLRAMLRICAWALGLAAVLSVLFAVALPAYGLSGAPHQGAWRGVFAHKNTLGSAMALSTILFALLARDARRWRWVAWGGAGLSAALVVLSQSTTAVVVLAAVLVLLPLFNTLRWRASRRIPLLIFAVLLAAGLVLGALANSQLVLSMLGRDATLTGRTVLWSAVVERIQERPAIGHGFRALWTLQGSGLRAALPWQSVDAHNGFLDLMLDLGLLGLAVFVAGLVAAARRGVRTIREVPAAYAAWPLVVLSFLLLQNLSETSILYSRSLLWLLFIATVCAPVAPEARAAEPPLAQAGDPRRRRA